MSAQELFKNFTHVVVKYSSLCNMYNVCVPLEDYEDMIYIQWANPICRHIPNVHVRALCHV